PPTNCPVPCLLSNGCVLVGRLGIGTASWTNLSSCPPRCITHVYLWNGSSFIDYSWNGIWTPQEPIVPIGQSVFICYSNSMNCCTSVPSAMVNGSFEVTSPPVNPNSFNGNLNPSTGVPGWITTPSFEVWCNFFGNIPASQ